MSPNVAHPSPTPSLRFVPVPCHCILHGLDIVLVVLSAVLCDPGLRQRVLSVFVAFIVPVIFSRWTRSEIFMPHLRKRPLSVRYCSRGTAIWDHSSDFGSGDISHQACAGTSTVGLLWEKKGPRTHRSGVDRWLWYS